MKDSEDRFWSLWARRMPDGVFVRVGTRVIAERGGRRVLGGAPVLMVVAIADPDGPYWGWKPRGSTSPCRVAHGRDAFGAMFPHGHTPEGEEADDLGRIVRLRILPVTGRVPARHETRRRAKAGAGHA